MDGCLQISFWGFHVHFSEVFHQQAVDEDISATDAAQEDQVNAVVEEGDNVFHFDSLLFHQQFLQNRIIKRIPTCF